MELFHVGYVVDDIAAAMAAYSAPLGLTWATVTPRPLCVRVDEAGDPVEVELLATYSQQGPPYVELIQELRGGVWTGGRHGARLDHLGYWEPDRAGAATRLRAAGCAASVQGLDADGLPSRFTYLRPGAGGGPWIELVDEQVKPELLAWIAGGDYVVSS